MCALTQQKDLLGTYYVPASSVDRSLCIGSWHVLTINPDNMQR